MRNSRRPRPPSLAALAALGVAVALVAGGAGAAPAPGSGARTAPAPADTVAIARMGIPQAMLAAARGEIVLVDVRPAGQRALGHIQGDVHIPFEQVVTRRSELPANKLSVFYCSCHAEELALDVARALLATGDRKVAVLVGGYDGWRAANGPFEVDATWEEIFRVDQPPSGWGKTPVDTLRCRYFVDDSVAAKGIASACIRCVPDTSARGYAGYTQKIDAAGLRGRTLTLSAMVRSENLERGAFLWIGAEDEQGRVLGMTRPEDLITGTQAWRISEVSGVVPPVAVKVLIGISQMASGRVWLDDVRLVAQEGGGLPRLRLVVENTSFEE